MPSRRTMGDSTRDAVRELTRQSEDPGIQSVTLVLHENLLLRHLSISLFVERGHLSASALLPLSLIHLDSLAAPVSTAHLGPAVSCRRDRHAGVADASPPSPASATPAFLWRSDRPGGPASAGFGNIKERRREDEKEAQSRFSHQAQSTSRSARITASRVPLTVLPASAL
ncbi:hypothetical protein F2P81_010710 [Scophthalmus maximus]|uniref:Uncharacterized protein n=1 Tax=Scophthalmus maximus TaxID=52904 RepID=A0A6A4SRM4_SCOMX|nr:hypothetical protein F2P81_010710 [Scophthalmus maximus]